MFWMLIFEGAVRKWVAPQFSSYIYFMRDPVCLLTYFFARRGGLFASPHPLLVVALIIAFVGSLFAVVNLAVGGTQYNGILAAYGFRNYFFYVPLAFVVARAFRYADIIQIAKYSMLAICIAAPIAVMQFNSAPDSILNAGSATDPDHQFQNLASGSGKVRPAGTFTSVMGMTHLCVSTIALLMWAWSSPQRSRPVNIWLVRLALIAEACAVAVSGSRTTFVHSCLVIAAGIGIAPLLPGATAKARTLALPLVAAVSFALLFPVVFPVAFQTFADRWTNAAQTEGQQFELGWFGRALYGFYDFFRLFDKMPMIGHGIGIAGNGAANLGVRLDGIPVGKLAEEDWSRHVVELGPTLALVFILFRVSFAIWLGINAVRSSIASANPLPVLLFTYCGIELVYAQITGHGLVNGFGWLYVGLCMASCVQVTSAELRVTPGKDGKPAASSSAVLPFPNLMR
jgi:hypothetical protein